ncbi:MAG: hypothetical protein HC945_03130 [Nitrosarchaeum sp.]|nr:hypothetical protein [Nitrosarchaeum sp.]
MTQITIRIDSLLVERLIYVVIILVLGIFVLRAYAWDANCPEDCTPVLVSGNVSGQGVSGVDEADLDAGGSAGASDEEGLDAPGVPATTAELCSNGVKDGDEVAVDCGGRCGDVSGRFFYEGACHDSLPTDRGQEGASGVVAGSRSFKIEDVSFDISADTGKIKILSISVAISNGDEALVDLTGEVFVRDDRGRLDEFHTISPSDPMRPYEVMDFRTIAKDEVFDGEVFLDAPVWLFSTTDEEDFEVEIDFYEGDEKVGDASKTMSP